ncbi:ACP S-malonyltransferase [Spirillospora sp. CA-255316]
MSVSGDVSSGWVREAGAGGPYALLFPGTGSAGPPDLRALAAAHPAAAGAVLEVLDAVDAAAGQALAEGAEAVPTGPAGRPSQWPSLREILLTDPDRYPAAATIDGVPQLAAYTASVAVDRVLRAAGAVPGFAVGQSFGEIAALVSAGVFGVAEGARMALSLVGVLVRAGAGGGLGLLLDGEERARALIEGAGAGAEVVVACVNAPSVTVVSGPEGPLEEVLAHARGAGVRAVRLAVPYLSHHPAMAGADAQWYEIIRTFPQGELRMPVYSPVRGRAYRDSDDLHRALADCIVKPVRLPEVLREVDAAGARAFVEAGAGDALCQCAQACVPGARTLVPLPDRRRSRPGPRQGPVPAPSGS